MRIAWTPPEFVCFWKYANRLSRFSGYLQSSGGVHAILTFVDHPDIPPAPDWSEGEFLYAPGELREYYAEWKYLHSHSLVFDDDSGGEPHKHAVEEYVFEKP